MEGFKRLTKWFRNLWNGKEAQYVQTPIIAFAWNGGASTRYEVKGVSPNAAYIVTGDTWYPGTIVTMTFQYDPYYMQVAAINGHARAFVRVRAKIIRHRQDGAEVRFVYLNEHERKRFKEFLSGGAVHGLR